MTEIKTVVINKKTKKSAVMLVDINVVARVKDYNQDFPILDKKLSMKIEKITGLIVAQSVEGGAREMLVEEQNKRSRKAKAIKKKKIKQNLVSCMKKVSFDFLANMPLKEIDKTPMSVIGGGKTPAAGADFRLFSDGSIYASSLRITQDQLEFQKKDSGIPEYGYDVFLSTDWSQYASTVKFPCIAKVSKHLPKVDLFGQTKFDKTGNPKSTIANLKTTQGVDLIKYLEASYCEEGESLFSNGKTYVDLRINVSSPVPETANKIYNIPKTVQKGKDAGKPVYVRRENIVIFPIEIVESSTVTTPPVQTGSITAPATSTPVPKDVAQAVFGN